MAEALTMATKLGLKAPAHPRPTGTGSAQDAAQEAAYYQSLIESLGGADPVEAQEGAQSDVQDADSYEARIRELLDGDQEKGPH